MAVIISSTNNKGWVWKTTTTVFVAKTLSETHWKRVLVIDLDQQCNLSQAFLGKNWFKEDPNVWELFNPKSDIDIKSLIKNVSSNLDIIPWKVQDVFYADALLKNTMDVMQDSIIPALQKNDLRVNPLIKDVKHLYKISLSMTDDSSDSTDEYEKLKNSILKRIAELKEKSDADNKKILEKARSIITERDVWVKVLKKKISYIDKDYDYIILDLPPSVSRVPENAWVASDFLMIPISDTFSLNWTEGLIWKMTDIKKHYNPSLRFMFFFTKVDMKRKFLFIEEVEQSSKNIQDTFKKAIDAAPTLAGMSHIVSTNIRNTKDVEKMYNTNSQDIRSTQAFKDYSNLTKELLEITNNYNNNNEHTNDWF